MEELIKKEWKLIDNSIFPSKEDDGIEHIDDSYKGFKVQITMAFERMYQAGRTQAIDDAVELVEKHDPSSGRDTSPAYWGNTLRQALSALEKI